MKNKDLESLEEFSPFEKQLTQIGEDIKNSPIDENSISKLETALTDMFTKLIGTFENITNTLEKEIKTLNN